MHSEIPVERDRHRNHARCHDIPHESHANQCTCRVQLIRINQVLIRRDEYREYRKARGDA